MEALHTQAQWLADQKRMVVTLRLAGQTFVERFTRSQWRRFIADLDRDPMRIAGLTIRFRGDPQRSAQAAEGIRRYLRRVDAAFCATGTTDRI